MRVTYNEKLTIGCLNIVINSGEVPFYFSATSTVLSSQFPITVLALVSSTPGKCNLLLHEPSTFSPYQRQKLPHETVCLETNT